MSISKTVGRCTLVGLVVYLFVRRGLVLRPPETAAAFSALIAALLNACSGNGAPASLRVGHTYVNGNCALDSENKLTGLCEGSGKIGCITHEPDPDSPQCKVGLVVKESKTPACSAATSQEIVSREYQCFFVDR